MASGIYGQVDLVAEINTTVYGATVPTKGVYNIRFCNRNLAPAKVRLAISATASPTAAEWIEYDMAIGANDVLEETGIPIQSGKFIVAYSDIANVSVAVWGIE